MKFDRKTVIERLRAQVAAGKPIVGAGAGTGLSAKCAEAGGADLVIIYNSGRFRMDGRGSLAGLMCYGNANDIVIEMARQVLTIVKDVPVIAGVCGTDPTHIMERLLIQLRDIGFAGVINFPTVGLCDGVFRQNLEETDMSFSLEVDMIRQAHELDIFTMPYVFSVDEGVAMAKAGADVLVTHMGLTTKGAIGARTAKTLEECAALTQAIRDAAVKINPEIIVICHGGPISEPEDTKYMLENTRGIVGFVGASSMERLPTEIAITKQVESFKALRL